MAAWYAGAEADASTPLGREVRGARLACGEHTLVCASGTKFLRTGGFVWDTGQLFKQQLSDPAKVRENVANSEAFFRDVLKRLLPAAELEGGYCTTSAGARVFTSVS